MSSFPSKNMTEHLLYYYFLRLMFLSYIFAICISFLFELGVHVILVTVLAIKFGTISHNEYSNIFESCTEYSNTIFSIRSHPYYEYVCILCQIKIMLCYVIYQGDSSHIHVFPNFYRY